MARASGSYPAGRRFESHLRYQIKNKVFQKRNISILVHGNYTYDLNEVKKTYDLVISMAKIYDKNMDKYLEYTKFPTFKI